MGVGGLSLEATRLVVEPDVSPESSRERVRRESVLVDARVVAREGLEREGPAVARAAEDDVSVERVHARGAGDAGVDDGVDVLEHGDQLVVGVVGGKLQVGDQSVHLREGDGDREPVSERLADAALRVEHDAFDRVDADQRAVADAETYVREEPRDDWR